MDKERYITTKGGIDIKVPGWVADRLEGSKLQEGVPMRKEVDDASARLRSAHLTEGAKKQVQQEAGKEEIRRFYEEFEQRSELLKRAARDFLSPWVAALRQTGIVDVLEELKQEAGISEEIGVGNGLTYFCQSEGKFFPHKLQFKGLALECGDWGFWEVNKANYERLSLDLRRKEIKERAELVNSINPSGRYGFQTDGSTVHLSWEASRQKISFREERFGRPYENRALPGSIWIVNHEILGYFDEGNINVFYITDSSRGDLLGRYVEGLEVKAPLAEKVAFPRNKWGDRGLLRKIVAEAYARRAS